jgi:outer membrane protein assembly factor BamB
MIQPTTLHGNSYACARMLLFVALAAFVGCGGRSETSNGTGRATITILWPSAGRLIPAESNSIKIVFTKSGSIVAQQVVDRRSAGPASVLHFDPLPVGELLVTSTAYPGSDAAGVAQATASVPIGIRLGQDTAFSITMESTIRTLEVTPGTTSLKAGESVQLTATARNAAGAVVLTQASAISWASSDPAIVTVDATGRATAQKEGFASISATDTESKVGGAASITVSGTLAPPNLAISPWPKERGDPRNMSRTSGSVGTGALRWRFGPFSWGLADSAILDAEGHLFAVSRFGLLYKFYAATGTQLWEAPIGGGRGVSSPVLSNDGTIYVGSKSEFGSGTVGAYRADTGQLKWKVSMPEVHGLTPPTPTLGRNGVLYVSYVDTFEALNALTGAKIWDRTIAGLDESPVAIGDDGTIFLGADKVFAIDPATGATKWSFKNSYGSNNLSPSLGPDGTVYVAGGALYALDPLTGAEKWNFIPNGGISIRAAIGADGTVYAGGGSIFALNPTTGTPKWEFPLGAYGISRNATIGADGTVYVAGDRLFAIDSVTGAKKWEFDAGVKLRSTTVGTDGTIYIGSQSDGSYLYAIH